MCPGDSPRSIIAVSRNASGEPVIGQILKDTYRIERLLGEGGMGSVYEASHLRLARRFAVKVLLPGLAAHPEVLARFQREAQVTGRLGHPHIVEVIDFDRTPRGEPYLVVELLEGENLADRLRRVGRMDLTQAASILRQAAAALQAAHQQGVVHRDLKPQNLFLCRRGARDDFVKVVDFGISKVLGAASDLTRTQSIIGTPVYMSPEQADQRGSAVDARTDVYAMGVILFEMLTGEVPFSASSIPQLLYKIVYHQPPALRSLRPDLPDRLEQVMSRVLAKPREDRFGSMLELWEAFRAAIALEESPEEPTEDRGSDWTGGAAAVSAASMASATLPPLDGTAPPERTGGLEAGLETTLPASLEEPRPPGHRRSTLFALAAGCVVLASGTAVFIAWPERPRVATRRSDARPSRSTLPASQGRRDAATPQAADAAPPAKADRSPPLSPTVARPRAGRPSRSAVPRRPAPEEIAAFGYLSVGADPYAHVEIDGRSVGNTPLVREKLRAGEHTLVLISPESGAVRLRRVLVLRENEHQRVTVP